MDGNPAGWYDDPEEPGSKRYWDGTAWTQDRAPDWNTATAETAQPFDPLGEEPPAGLAPLAPGTGPTPPMTADAPSDASGTDPTGPLDPGTPAGPSSGGRGLWVAVAIAGVVAVVGIVAIVALMSGGEDTDHTATVEQNVPAALQRNYADQGLEVVVTGATCEPITNGVGPYSTDCTVSFRGTARTIVATVTGTIDDDTATIDNAFSETNLLDESLAIGPVQTLVDQRIEGLTVTGCTLPETPLVMQDGDEFTCELDNGQTVTLATDGASVRLSAVS
jgi:hypothetical protein